MTLDIWLALATMNFFSAIAPGQNVALLTGTTVRGGTAAGGKALFGILIAEVVWTLLALAVVTGLLAVGETIIEGLRGAGGALLVILGVSILRARAAKGAGPEQSSAGLVTRGACVGFANPITLVFFTAVFPQFIGAEETLVSLIWFCLPAIVVSTALALAPYLLLASFLTRPCLSSMLQGVSGLALVGMGGLFIAGAVA